MSVELEKAKAQIAAGQYKQAVSMLWEAERWAQGDLTEAHRLLAVAAELRDKADGRLKGDCDYFIKWAEKCIEKESAKPLVALAASAIAVVGGCTVLGGHGLPPQAGQSWNLIFSQGRLHLVRGLVIADVAYADVVALEIGGPGAQRRGGGFFAGGFGVTGAAEGMLVAAALSLLTTSTAVSTVVCLMTSSAELFLHTSSETPDDLRMRLSPVFSVLRQQETAQAAAQGNGGGSVVERLAKLASLLEKDLISREEFDRLKADLLQTV